MHFHLPKPLHGWREFVGEVGIIVIGVLIALGAEQAVERLHHHSQVHEAEKKLRAESIENRHVIDFDVRTLGQAVSEIDARIAALHNCRTAPSAGLRPLTRNFILVPSDASWIGIRDGALLPLMPDRTSDNYWKIDTIKEAMRTAADNLVQYYVRAAGAVDAMRGGATGGAVCSEALLALNQLKQQELTVIALANVFRAANEQELHGEKIDRAGPPPTHA